jgi:hypothetical protein
LRDVHQGFQTSEQILFYERLLDMSLSSFINVNRNIGHEFLAAASTN